MKMEGECINLNNSVEAVRSCEKLEKHFFTSLMDNQLSRFYLPLYEIKNIKYCSVSFRSSVPFIVFVLICVFVFAFAVHISCHVMFTRRAHCRSYMLVYANYMLCSLKWKINEYWQYKKYFLIVQRAFQPYLALQSNPKHF